MMSDQALLDDHPDLRAPDRIVIPYSPRPHQKKLHAELKRFNVLVCHRRFGKTVFAINELIKQTLHETLPDARTAYICPTQVQARKVAWLYLKKFTAPVPGIKHNESSLTAKFVNGAEISLLGSENYHALRGLYLDYVVMDEVAQQPPEAWAQVIRPALSDRLGGAIFIGTPLGRQNKLADLYHDAPDLDGWYRYLAKASETSIIVPSELAAMQQEMSPEEYAQELECSWTAAIKGAYYANEMELMRTEGRICTVPYDENYPVITAWDLGVRDSTVVGYWQSINGQHRLLRTDEFKYTGLPDIIKKVNSYNYQFAQHIAPHDIAVYEFGSGQKRVEIAFNLGIEFDPCDSHGVTDGINAMRTGLKNTAIDEVNNKTLIAAWTQYRTEYNELKRVFSAKPLHDWCSDFADMGRYYYMADKQTGFFGQTSNHNYKKMDKGRF